MSRAKRLDRERNKPVKTSAVLIAVQRANTSDAQARRSLDELEQLARGIGLEATERFVQKRDSPVASTYLGEGKLKEVAAITGGPGAVPRGPAAGQPDRELRDDVVVIADDELNSGQLRNLQAALGASILDRTAVILRVFASRAQTREAKLAIELAQLGYELPRIRDDHALGDREGGGGRAARGHSNVELAKQRIHERSTEIRRELERLRRVQTQQRRARSELFRVALVGYTNAGKSSLMRSLTGTAVLIEDKLFATLGTTVRPLHPPSTPPVLLVDTVGFVDRLPHKLVESFHATLAEAAEAWLLLHVVDACDPAFRARISVTGRVLAELGVSDTPSWLVFNKVDRLAASERAALAAEYPNALQVSALDPADGSLLRQRIIDALDEHLVEARFSIPYDKHALFASLRDRVRVVAESYGEQLDVTIVATSEVVGQLRRQLAQGGR